MKLTSKIEALMLAVLYDEASAEEAEELMAAMEDSPELKSRFQELEATVTMIDASTEQHDPGQEYWDMTWERFQDAVLREEKQQGEQEGQQTVWNLFWKPALQIGTVAVILILGIFIGRQLTLPASEPQPIAKQQFKEVPDTDYQSEPVRDNVRRERQNYIQTVASDSLQNSSRMIDGFMQLQPVNADPKQSMEWLRTRDDELQQLRRNLSILRNTYEDESIQGLEPILQELELLINEIATIKSMDEEDLIYEIRFLQEGIKRRNLEIRIREVDIER